MLANADLFCSEYIILEQARSMLLVHIGSCVHILQQTHPYRIELRVLPSTITKWKNTIIECGCGSSTVTCSRFPFLRVICAKFTFTYQALQTPQPCFWPTTAQVSRTHVHRSVCNTQISHEYSASTGPIRTWYWWHCARINHRVSLHYMRRSMPDKMNDLTPRTGQCLVLMLVVHFLLLAQEIFLTISQHKPQDQLFSAPTFQCFLATACPLHTVG